ncbi:hypothetical protein MMC24_004341 [Lignoscripta atroalba]|nr:hypothetical protein [Lignoscripta atroalba]
MSTSVYILLSPFLLAVSIPLAGFALLTTTLAFSTLFIRVIIVYIELGIAVVHNQFVVPPSTTTPTTKSRRSSLAPDCIHARRKSRRSSTGSGQSEADSTTPKILDTPNLGIYSGTAIDRDFEGVGGWRFPGPDDEEDVLWTSMNSRLELPAKVGERQRKHQRSLTSGSLASAPFDTRFKRGFQSPDLSTRSPLWSRARTPGTASPEESYAPRLTSKSTTALGEANMGKSMTHRKSSSSISTLSSASSAKTLQLKIPGG